ncbi:MAG: 16S rRNA (cytosine(1402)-N(4))-methyltransferase, partial [Armatimonadetes bacterium]|nr:16S rRNA (cytosine(1402)-N(4))-methyltransferase [Armatimonadota bacterium]
MSQPRHRPAMPEQVIAYLDIQPAGTYIDMTVGSGGHAALILEASAPDGRLIAIDRDGLALEVAQGHLARFGQRVQFFQRRFSELPDVLAEAEVQQVNGVLIDTG